MRILIIEDDDAIGRAVAAALAGEGFAADRAADGESALDRVRDAHYDLVLLDLNLPGLSGFQVLRAIRTMHLPTPVLIVTARDHVDDRVEGLDLGADDYLVKPFAMAELLARVRALQRRAGDEAPYRLAHAGVELDLLRRTASRDGRQLDLTAKEFEVLELLMRNAEKPVSRSMLAKVVWHDVPRATSLDNVIDVHLGRLRKKIDEPFGTRLVHTIRGVGFALKAGDGDPPQRS